MQHGAIARRAGPRREDQIPFLFPRGASAAPACIRTCYASTVASAHAHKNTRIHAHARIHAPINPRARARTHPPHTHSHTHTHTHTGTGACVCVGPTTALRDGTAGRVWSAGVGARALRADALAPVRVTNPSHQSESPIRVTRIAPRFPGRCASVGDGREE